MENITGQRIKQERENYGWTQQYLAQYLDLPDSSYISKAEKGIRKVTPEELIKLSNLFGCTIEFLVGQTENRNPVSSYVKQLSNQKYNHIPIIGTIRAGLPILADENIEGYLDVPDSLEADYVLLVTGDSMIGAGILEDDYAICRKAEMAQSGQIVVALKDMSTGFSEATLKYYFEGNGDGPELRPANPSYHEFYMKDGFRIAGVMIALFRQSSPSYQVYRNYLAVNDHDEWTEVIDLANQSGLKVNQVRKILESQVEIAKHLKIF